MGQSGLESKFLWIPSLMQVIKLTSAIFTYVDFTDVDPTSGLLKLLALSLAGLEFVALSSLHSANTKDHFCVELYNRCRNRYSGRPWPEWALLMK